MAKLILAGQEYDLDTLIKSMGSCPHIKVEVKDLMPEEEASDLVQLQGNASKTVAFFKREGKMMVLFGDVTASTSGSAVSGVLISGPVLKRSRLGTLAIFNQPSQESSHPGEFANRPRFVDKQSRQRTFSR